MLNKLNLEPSGFTSSIKIDNYKCFKNFETEGFGRVNLIGGKNNTGKTAFMEAIYLVNSLQFDKIKPDILKLKKDELDYILTQLLITILTNRKGFDFLTKWILDIYDLNSFTNIKIEIPNKILIESIGDNISISYWNYDIEKIFKKSDKSNKTDLFSFIEVSSFKLSKHQDNKLFYKIRQKNSPPNIDIFKFATPCNSNDKNLRKLLSNIKKNNKNDIINKYLENTFKVDKIDLTDEEIIIFNNDMPLNYSEFGDGIKNFLNIVLTILTNKNTTIFLDEIENGIHYTNLDKLWEIILTISKEKNVQVFATTHSKECIESYARVAKKLDDKDIKFLSLYKNSENKLKSNVFNYEDIQERIELGLDNR